MGHCDIKTQLPFSVSTQNPSYMHCNLFVTGLRLRNSCSQCTFLGNRPVLVHIVRLVLWFHDDVIKWKHFPRYWRFVRGIHRSPVNFPHKGQWRRALMLSLICVWIKGWVNNRDTGDLRRYRAHYDVTVMGNQYLLKMYIQLEFQEWNNTRDMTINGGVGLLNGELGLGFYNH